MDRKRLGEIYILPDEIIKIVSASSAASDYKNDLLERATKSSLINYEFFNFTSRPVRAVSQDGIEIKLNPCIKPENVKASIVIKKTICTYVGVSELDPLNNLNSPETDMLKAIAREKNAKVSCKFDNVTKTVNYTVFSVIDLEQLEITGTVHDIISNYVITQDVSRTIIHPNTAKAKELNENFAPTEDTDYYAAYNKYVLVDNTGVYQELYLNTGHNVLSVKAITDISRPDGLYVYSYGVCKASRHRSTKVECVKFDVKTILSEKIFAFLNYQEACSHDIQEAKMKDKYRKEAQVHRGTHDDEYRRQQEQYSERQMKQKESLYKVITETIKIVGTIVTVGATCYTAYIKVNSKC